MVRKLTVLILPPLPRNSEQRLIIDIYGVLGAKLKQS